MTLTKIKSILSEYHLSPLESLSQNFFIDKSLLQKMVRQLNIPKKSLVIEIGCGLGSLTEILVENNFNVVGFEIDRTLANILPDILGNPNNLTLYHQDILESEEYFQNIKSDYYVIANIPYNITGKIIRFLLSFDKKAKNIVLLVQKEVAFNLTNNDDKYSFQKLSISLYADVSKILNVPKECFYPKPKVDSAVIQITPNNKYDFIEDKEALLSFIKPLFQRKRKQLRSSIKSIYKIETSIIENMFRDLNVDSDIRPEDMSIENWYEVYNKSKEFIILASEI